MAFLLTEVKMITYLLLTEDQKIQHLPLLTERMVLILHKIRMTAMLLSTKERNPFPSILGM